MATATTAAAAAARTQMCARDIYGIKCVRIAVCILYKIDNNKRINTPWTITLCIPLFFILFFGSCWHTKCGIFKRTVFAHGKNFLESWENFRLAFHWTENKKVCKMFAWDTSGWEMGSRGKGKGRIGWGLVCFICLFCFDVGEELHTTAKG